MSPRSTILVTVSSDQSLYSHGGAGSSNDELWPFDPPTDPLHDPPDARPASPALASSYHLLNNLAHVIHPPFEDDNNTSQRGGGGGMRRRDFGSTSKTSAATVPPETLTPSSNKSQVEMEFMQLSQPTSGNNPLLSGSSAIKMELHKTSSSSSRWDVEKGPGPNSTNGSSLTKLTSLDLYDLADANQAQIDDDDEEAALKDPYRRTMAKTSTPTLPPSRTLSLCWGAGGIYVSYLFYGHFQEDIFRYRDPAGGKFDHVWLLQALESITNIGMGLLGRALWGGRKHLPWRPFLQTGTSQVLAKALTSWSLACGVSFPVCVLAKSAKIVPVMLGQLFLGGANYTAQDYFYSLLIVLGTALLSSSGKTKPDASPAVSDHSSSGVAEPSVHHPTHDHPDTYFGLILIVLSLVMDGVTGGLQKRIKRDLAASPPTTYDFLLYTNMFMAVIALTISTVTGESIRGLVYLSQHEEVARMVVILCICASVGQSFVFYVVATFDPLVCSTITTTRKILSVLWSISVKGHVLSMQGTTGLFLAIVGLLLGMTDHSRTSSKSVPASTQEAKAESKAIS